MMRGWEDISRRRKGLEDRPVGIINPRYRGTRPPTVKTTKDRKGISIAEAIERYMDARETEGQLKHKTRGQVGTSLRLFSEHMGGDTQLAKVSRLDITKWREKMRRLHPRWGSSPSSRDMPLEDLLAIHGQGQETLSDKTLSRHLSALHTMFNWAIMTGYFDGDNPVVVVGSKGKPRFQRGTFTDQEVRNLFERLELDPSPVEHSHSNALPWIMLLGAYSGVRLDAVCSLKPEDVKESGDIYYLDIRDDKTGAGTRQVPVHSKVIEAGFLNYVKSCPATGYLFPSLGEPNKDGDRSTYIGKKITQLCRKCGIEKDLVGFHYWRTTVATKLENAGVPEIDAARVVGHKIKTMTYGVYSGGPDLVRLREVVEQIQYD